MTASRHRCRQSHPRLRRHRPAARSAAPRAQHRRTGITRLIAALQPHAPELVVLEATGPYHRPLLSALVAADLPTVLANPAQVAAFRQARLGREKSDRADAKLLARFAAVHGDELPRAAAADPLQARLRDLVAYRDGLVGEQTRLRNRIHANGFGGDARGGGLAGRGSGPGRGAAARGRRRNRPAAGRPARGGGAAGACRGRPRGWPPRCSPTCRAPLWGDPKAAAAYAGVHPRRDQSGQRDRSRLSKQGHAGLRRYLYLAADRRRPLRSRLARLPRSSARAGQGQAAPYAPSCTRSRCRLNTALSSATTRNVSRPDRIRHDLLRRDRLGRNLGEGETRRVLLGVAQIPRGREQNHRPVVAILGPHPAAAVADRGDLGRVALHPAGGRVAERLQDRLDVVLRLEPEADDVELERADGRQDRLAARRSRPGRRAGSRPLPRSASAP